MSGTGIRFITLQGAEGEKIIAEVIVLGSMANGSDIAVLQKLLLPPTVAPEVPVVKIDPQKLVDNLPTPPEDEGEPA